MFCHYLFKKKTIINYAERNTKSGQKKKIRKLGSTGNIKESQLKMSPEASKMSQESGMRPLCNEGTSGARESKGQMHSRSYKQAA